MAALLIDINICSMHLCLLNQKFMKRIIYLLSATLLFVFSCTTAKMAVSDELKTEKDEYKVKGRNGTRIKQKLSFGEYATTSIKRSWTKGSSSRTGIGYGGTAQEEWVNIISMEYVKRKQTIQFQLSDGGQQSDVYCVSRFNAKELEIGKSNSLLNIGIDLLGMNGRPGSTYYVQLFTSSNAERPWEMMIDNEKSQEKPKEYIGYLAKSKTEYYSIVPVRNLETPKGVRPILAGSVGFEFRNAEGRPVAAVSLMDNGVVFLSKLSPEERFLLANACTALLLQDVIG